MFTKAQTPLCSAAPPVPRRLHREAQTPSLPSYQAQATATTLASPSPRPALPVAPSLTRATTTPLSPAVCPCPQPPIPSFASLCREDRATNPLQIQPSRRSIP
ncbi:hypothetical protein M0R45_005052 [Rubus argutus]|uniref:Uncharacterized protein n=1 Tax=Rubus argutus TaxID=59490 RepID=A0AAW1YM40_RUBAR